MSTWTYSASTELNLMKTKYGTIVDKQFNADNILFGRIKMMKDFVGDSITFPVVQSIGGGVAAGSLPTASESKIGKVTLATKKLYAVVSVDRESMQASKTSEGAFVKFTKFPVKMAMKSFNRNLERMITRGDINGSGALLTGNASNNTNVAGAGTTGSPYVIVFNAPSTYNLAHAQQLEEGDLVNINSETTALEVVTIAEAGSGASYSLTISLVGTSSRLGTLSGSAVFGASDIVYMQKSKDAELIGIDGVVSATAGSYKGITIGRRWKSYIKDASSAALSTDLLNEVIMNMKRTCGEQPEFLLASFKQYIALLNLLEDQKTYNLPARDKKYKGQISFSGIEYLGPQGAIPVFASRFIDDEKIYFLNTKYIELHLRPEGFVWFDEDGTVFLREATDSYEARYGGYGDLFINPHFQGLLDNLA